ncbi:MAG TPA: PQQ-binding-like beta-propeller repeat protein, partial [Rubrobacter sp.]|nr:PQQ-binding-like beta-propeller repeat protein [Rubrobacter sp.]
MTQEYIDAPPPVALGNLSAVPGDAPPVAKDVTYERILDAREGEPHNWITYYGAYDGKRYSLLDQINKDNVKRLTPAFVFQSGSQGLHAGPSTYAFEAAPLVVDGVMFVSGWDGFLWCLDAKTGQTLWQYKHAIPFDVSLCCGNVNRGVAVANGKVFLATLNAHVVALDAQSGEKIWDTVHGDVRAGESATVAPLVVKDKVIVGSSGGEFGTRGHLDAYDMETGERVWRCYMIPKPGEPGSETWPDDGEAWQRGGGNCWVTGTYDPELNLMYWGTGNPAPDFDGEVRPGDNLYTDSVVAVNPDTGEKVWHYQYTPHDLWDYDSNMECILFEQDGRKLLAHFDKNGYCFVLDRTTG